MFKTDSVKLYRVVDAKNLLFSCNHEVHKIHDEFIIENDEKLSELVLPPSKDNVVYIFRRKSKEDN